MAGFHFRLSALLSLRTAQRDARRIELAAALADCASAGVQLRRSNDRLQQHWHETRGRTAPGTMDLDGLRSAGEFEAALHAQLATLAERVRAAEAVVDQLQVELAATEGEVRVLEKLRERQLAEFRGAQSRSASRQADERAALAHERSGEIR